MLTFTLGALWNGSDAEAVNLSKRLLGLRRKLSQQTYISGFWKRQGDDLLFALTKVFSECLELARARGELDELTRSLLGGLAKDIASYFASPFFKAVVTAFKFCIPRRYFEEEWAAGHHAIEALLRSPEACSTLRHGTHRSAERRSDDASLELRRQLTENYADTFLFELLGATFDADSQAYRLPDDWQARVPIPLVINAYFGLVTSDSKAQRFQDPAHRDGDNVPGSLSLALYHGQFTGGPLSIDLLQDSRLPLIFQPTCGAVGGFRFDALIHHVSTSGVTGQRLTVILFLDRHLNDVAAGRKPFAIARDKNQTRSYLQAPADIDMQTASSASATRKDLDNHVASVRAAFPGPISGGIDVAAAAAAAAGATPTPRSSPKRKGVVAHNDSPVPLKSPRLGRSQSAHDHQAVVVPRSRSAQFQQVVSVTSQFYSGPGRRR